MSKDQRRSSHGELWGSLRLCLNLLFLVCIALLVYGGVMPDDGIESAWKSRGLETPSSGLTGSVQLFFRGDFQGSIAVNRAGVWLMGWAMLALISRPFLWRRTKPLVVIVDALVLFCGWAAICLIFFW